ncbi:MAG: Hsp20/alpha crystallin family protein [Sphingobacteriales bacterium]|nr:Hsp20/alpha crystallin family protein [Sphingobacteriales bacterium]
MTFVKFKNNGPLSNHMLEKMFNPLYHELFSPSGFDSTTVAPAVNVLESAEHFQIELAAPGLTKEAFNIKLEKEVLTISTAKKEDVKAEGLKYTRKEFGYHSFKRSFNLPEIADQENISAEYKEGILYVTIMKMKVALPTVKEIKIS